MTTLTPAQVIEMVRARRGLEPGPPADVILPNRNMILPEDEERGEDELQGVATPHGPEPEAVPRPGRPATSPNDPENEGVSLTNGGGYFMGHPLKLNESERNELKSLLAGVVLRQLDEERAKIRGAKGNKR